MRIQQEVGGKLADLLHTLADFVRARQEVRREVQVLTAEGRLSTVVLGALPVFIIVALQVVNSRSSATAAGSSSMAAISPTRAGSPGSRARVAPAS